MKVQEIELDKIDQNENSRVVYKESDLVDLMESMRKDGLLQPVGVRKAKDRFDAVWGNRRIVAARKLGWHTISSNVVEADTDDDRDVLNLIENLKRQNTTLPEDGRIFCQLKERGLSVKEISARVGVTTHRIELAMESFEEIPKEYHKKMLNVGQGATGGGRPGFISAKTSYEIMRIRKDNGLNRKQTRTLLEAARTGDINSDTLRIAAPAMKEGLKLNAAIQLMKEFDTTTLRVYFSRKAADKIEKRTGKTIVQVLLDFMETFPDMDVTRRVTADTGISRKKDLRVRRKGARESVALAAQATRSAGRIGVKP